MTMKKWVKRREQSRSQETVPAVLPCCAVAGVASLGNSGDGSDLFLWLIGGAIILVFLVLLSIYLVRSLGHEPPQTHKPGGLSNEPRAPTQEEDNEGKTRAVMPLPFRKADDDKTVPFTDEEQASVDEDAMTTVVPGIPTFGFPPRRDQDGKNHR